MHSAMLLDDIQFLIFQSLERRDLARLARTCKAFFAVATGELWRTINSFVPILRLLPEDYQYSYRALHAKDLYRFDFYTSKVKNLFLESSTVMALPPPFHTKHYKREKKRFYPEKTWEMLWEEISNLRPMSGTFSSLRRLRISNVLDRVLLPLVGISGLKMTHIIIQIIHNPQSPSNILKILDGMKDTPNLEALSVQHHEPLVRDIIKQSPLKHLRLEHGAFLCDSPLSVEILRKSTLQSLTLSLTKEWYNLEIEALHVGYLPALKRLWLNLTSIDANNSFDRARRPPTVFLQRLDNPDLSLLNIKFPKSVTGAMLLGVVAAAKNSCRLENLTELVLAGESRYPKDDPSPPRMLSADFRSGLSMLLPLVRLQSLRLTAGPNFLDVLDLKAYRRMANGLPALKSLVIGHVDFCDFQWEYMPTIYHDRVPLHHLAAFCSMLRKIKEVTIGTVDGLTLEQRPRKEWACARVETLRISEHADFQPGVSYKLMRLGLQVYFPNSGLADHKRYRLG